MSGQEAAHRRLDGLIWAIVAAVAGIELMSVAFGGFSLVLRSYAAPAATCLLLAAAAYVYAHRRNDPNIAAALGSTAQMMAFAAVGAPLSYLAATAAWPLQDAAFDAADKALGFDWRALLAVLEQRPGLHMVLRVIYASLSVQMAAAVLLLGFTGRLAWLRVYMLAFVFATLITIAVSAVLPAEGAWLHYGLKAADPAMLPVTSTSWPVFHGLRDGTFRLMMAVGSEGIVTFPSLHAALAVILIAAFWPVPVARWIGLTVNALMLAATPIDGSHYLIDVLAGIAIAAVGLFAARGLVARFTAQQQPSAGSPDKDALPAYARARQVPAE